MTYYSAQTGELELPCSKSFAVDHRYVALVVNTSWSFPHSRLIIGVVTRLTRPVPLVELNLDPSGTHEFTPVFSGIRVTRSIVLYVWFVDRCFYFCAFFFWFIVLSVLRYDCPFGIFKLFLVKWRDLNIELLTISPANIWKLSGLELKDILIQQELIFIEKDRTNIPEWTRTFILKEFKLEHWQRGQ